MRVLVTGSLGFIGRVLCRRLAACTDISLVTSGRKGADVDIDLCAPQAQSIQALAGCKADAIVHLASPALRTRHDRVDSELSALRNLTEAVWAPMVYLGTADEYGDDTLARRSESDPRRPMNDYGAAKSAAIEELARIADQDRRGYVILRPFCVYGPGQPDRMLLPSLIAAAGAGSTLRTAAQAKTRDYIHVEDVCAALECVLRADRFDRQTYNLGTGIGTTSSKLKEVVEAVTGQPIQLDADHRIGADNPRSLVANPEKILRELGFSPQTPLADGIKGWMKAT